MAKLTRREFLKRIALLGSIAPFVDVNALTENLSGFSEEQIGAISEIKEIRRSACGPYCLAPGHTWDNEYYDIYLKSGDKLWLSDKQIRERYGDILDYFLESGNSSLSSGSYPAILND